MDQDLIPFNPMTEQKRKNFEFRIKSKEQGFAVTFRYGVAEANLVRDGISLRVLCYTSDYDGSSSNLWSIHIRTSSGRSVQVSHRAWDTERIRQKFINRCAKELEQEQHLLGWWGSQPFPPNESTINRIAKDIEDIKLIQCFAESFF